jgi:hypothetical protein
MTYDKVIFITNKLETDTGKMVSSTVTDVISEDDSVDLIFSDGTSAAVIESPNGRFHVEWDLGSPNCGTEVAQ